MLWGGRIRYVLWEITIINTDLLEHFENIEVEFAYLTAISALFTKLFNAHNFQLRVNDLLKFCTKKRPRWELQKEEKKKEENEKKKSFKWWGILGFFWTKL